MLNYDWKWHVGEGQLTGWRLLMLLARVDVKDEGWKCCCMGVDGCRLAAGEVM